MNDIVIKTLKCLDYHVRKNLWSVQIGSCHDQGFSKQWRIAGAKCLSDRLAFDVRGDTLQEALEQVWKCLEPEVIAEAGT